jgi:hypothetical protein
MQGKTKIFDWHTKNVKNESLKRQENDLAISSYSSLTFGLLNSSYGLCIYGIFKGNYVNFREKNNKLTIIVKFPIKTYAPFVCFLFLKYKI